jgi:hypothetical protein
MQWMRLTVTQWMINAVGSAFLIELVLQSFIQSELV